MFCSICKGQFNGDAGTNHVKWHVQRAADGLKLAEAVLAMCEKPEMLVGEFSAYLADLARKVKGQK